MKVYSQSTRCLFRSALHQCLTAMLLPVLYLALCVFPGSVPAHAAPPDGKSLSSDIASDAAKAVSEAEDYESRFIFSEAIRLRLSADSLYSRSPDRKPYADNRFRLAKLYCRVGEYDMAYRYIVDVSRMYEEMSDYRAYLECKNILGAVSYAVRDYDRANEYFKEMAEGAEEIRDTLLNVYALTNMAVYTNSIGDSLRTNELISRSISLCKSLKDTSMLCQMYINLSASYINAADWARARECLSFAKPLLGTIAQEGQYHHYLGVLCFLTDRPSSEAVAHLDTALACYGQGEFFTEEQSCLAMLQEIYASEEEYGKAYDALHQYYVNHMQSGERDAVRKLFLAQNEILDRARDEELTVQRHRQTMVFVLSVSCLVIIAFAVFFLLKRKAYGIRMQEVELANRALVNEKKAQELAAKNEIAKLKELQRFNTDRLIEEMTDSLDRLGSATKDLQMRSELASICSQFRKIKDEDEWREVMQFVPDQDTDFYNRLIAAFPNLTINERRLCVFLNKNMTSKEISEITRQSLHSINIARGRLRSKLGITGDNMSIQEFLSKFN